MNYDINQLRNLRDNIDMYLTKEDEREQHIYTALENSIAKAVRDSLEPLIRELIEKSKQDH